MTHRKNRDLEEIIAAHRDTIEAKNALIGDLRRDLGEASQELRTANARDEAAERDAKQAWEEVSRVQQVGLRAESESAALRAEVRRLKVENHHLLQTKRWHEINAETRASLAAANALLGELRELHATVPRHCGLLEMVCFYNCVGERLAAQPATARSEPYPLGHGARHFPELYAQPATAPVAPWPEQHEPSRDEVMARFGVAQPATAVRPPNPEAVARILADPDCEAPTRTEVCDECGTIHGPANTNTLCSRSSNYRGLGHSAWRNRDTRTEDDLGRTDHPEATDDLAGALACLSVWEPDARVIGNVRAATLRALLQSVAARRPERWVR